MNLNRIKTAVIGAVVAGLSAVVVAFPGVAQAYSHANCTVYPNGSGCGTPYELNVTSWGVVNNSGGTLWCRPQNQSGNLAGEYGYVSAWSQRGFTAFATPGTAKKMICTYNSGPWPDPMTIDQYTN
jgi:hypothetical protein